MSPRLPALTSKDVIRALEKAGFRISRMSGSHCRLIHETDPSRKVTVPVHRGGIAKGTVHAIIRQAGLTVEEFAELLKA